MLYAILAAQVLIVFVGYFVLITSCCNERKRQALNYGVWTIKWSIVTFIAKWMLETYSIVEV